VHALEGSSLEGTEEFSVGLGAFRVDDHRGLVRGLFNHFLSLDYLLDRFITTLLTVSTVNIERAVSR